RVRQASLAEPLRGGAPARGEGAGREVTPEQMRSIFGSFQRGLDRGRGGEARTTDERTGHDG
ncbi:hypothetical protein, partial [Streptomyces sp. PR69]|uniref:hypothetical protein n=1 Tax=Streptomyces sp. PR69 TaxID=2984950 RepID=UPI002263B575